TWLLFRFVVAREIAADLRPAVSVIGGFENALARCVNYIGVMRRKHERRDPLETMGDICRAMAGIVERNGTDILHFLFIFIITDPSGAFVIRVNDVPIAGIGHYEAGFAAACFEPILPSDPAPIRAAGDAVAS